jgi:hypothetical protein
MLLQRTVLLLMLQNGMLSREQQKQQEDSSKTAASQAGSRWDPLKQGATNYSWLCTGMLSSMYACQEG